MERENGSQKSKLGSNYMIFAGSNGREFAQRMAEYLGTRVGRSTCIRFTEGNLFVRADETVRDKDIILVQSIGISPDTEFVEILFWLDAFKRASANTVTVVMPYFSYAQGDKKDEPRVSIRARVCAECMELAGADKFMIMDLHSMQVQGFFKKPADNLLPTSLLCEAVKKLGWYENLTVVATDAGGAKRVRKYSELLKAPFALGEKIRESHDESCKIMSVAGDVNGKNCLIVDDFTITGGTLVNLANSLKERGAKRIFASLSHNTISQEGAEKIHQSPIEFVLSTDSITNKNTELSDKFLKISAAPLFAEALLHDFKHQSVSELFTKVPKRLLDAAFKGFD